MLPGVHGLTRCPSTPYVRVSPGPSSNSRSQCRTTRAAAPLPATVTVVSSPDRTSPRAVILAISLWLPEDWSHARMTSTPVVSGDSSSFTEESVARLRHPTVTGAEPRDQFRELSGRPQPELPRDQIAIELVLAQRLTR